MRLPIAILVLMALLGALSTAHGHMNARDLQVICNTTSVKTESKFADNLFVKAVVNAVAAGCVNTKTWKGARNYWGVKGPRGEEHPVPQSREIPGAPHRKLLGVFEDALLGDDDMDGSASGRVLLGKNWSKYRRMKASFRQWGIAYARAIAYTQITCTSYDPSDPYECHASEVQAQAVAKARAKFVASAMALAFTQCGKCKLTAEARAQLSAELLLQLTAKATARVSAQVCVGAGGTASATGYMNCFGLSIARGMAKAIALAMIKGDCFMGVEAAAKVKAEVEADTHEFCACEGWMDVSAEAPDGGTAFAHVDTNGTCDAYSEQIVVA